MHGDAMKSPLNRAGKKHRFDKAWMHEHVNDPYVQEAQQRGYRSRAAFKLIELDERDRLLRPGMAVVDLGARREAGRRCSASGSGASGRIVAVDVLPMDGIAGVRFVEADFATTRASRPSKTALDGRRSTLCSPTWRPICRASMPSTRRAACIWPIWHSNSPASTCNPAATLAVKVFQGAGLAEFERAVKGSFGKVYLRKPKASRDRSRELFVVAKGFRR